MITARPIDPSCISKKDRETITEFYTTKEVLEIFSISNSWLFKVAKQQNIPKVTQHGKTYWSKKHCDMIFGKRIHLLTKSPNGILSRRFRKNTA